MNLSKRSLITPVLILLLCPLFLGTTFVIRENGKEVGRWTLNDNKDVTEYVEQADLLGRPASQNLIETGTELRDAMVPRPDLSKKEGETVTAEDPAEATREARHVQLAKERRQDWFLTTGIYGKTSDEVETIAARNGFMRYATTQERYQPPGKSQNIFRVHEYRYKTENFSHRKKVYFDNVHDRVVRVVHQATPR